MANVLSNSVPGMTSMRVVLVLGGAISMPDSLIRVQFWDTFNPAATGTALVFSDPIALQTFNTGPISVGGATAFTFNLPFATPISLTGLLNHGITFNWQSQSALNGGFSDDTLLTTALRTGTGGTVPPPALTLGADLNPSGGYFRNASALTTFDFQANDARNIANVGGPEFELTAAGPVPEPAAYAAAFLSVGAVGAYLLRRRQG